MPTVSELKDRARGFEQKGELATALKVYRHILAHLEGTPALGAELPLYVKIGDLSAKLGAGADAVEMYRKAGTQYAQAGSARTLVALALKVVRVDPARREVYGHFAQDLLTRGHDRAAAEVMGAAAEQAGLTGLRAALAWAGERSDEDARGVLVRLAEALAQSDAAAEQEAGLIVAAPGPTPAPVPPAAPPVSATPPAVPPPPPPIPAPPPPAPPPVEEEEPLELERISEAEPPTELPTIWSADEPELMTASAEPDGPPPAADDLGLATDRWREALEEVVPPAPRGQEPPPWPEPPAVEPRLAVPPPEPPPPSPAPPPLELAPLVEPAAPVPPPPPPAAEAAAERVSARRSGPRERVLLEEPAPRRSRAAWIAVAAVLAIAAGAAAVVFDLVPLGSGGLGGGNPPPRRPTVNPSAPPVADSTPAPTTVPAPAATGPADTAPAVNPVTLVPDAAPPGNRGGEVQGDTAVADTAAPPPAPVVVPPPVTAPPPPVATLDTTGSGPPTVQVPPGTSLRDLLIVVPGMPVESVVAVPVGGRRGHRVVQRLPDGELLVLTTAPMSGADTVGVSDARITVAGDTTVGSVRFWSFLVTARARADADTLARLLRRLERARPVR